MQPFCVTKKDFIFCRIFIAKGEQLGRAEVDAVRHRRYRRGGRRHHSTGSPFGHHPRLSMVCPRWGQWVSTWSILRGLSSVHHEMSMYLSVDTLSHALTTAAACTDNASGGGAPCVTAGDTRAISEGEPVGKWTEDTPTPAASH